MNHRLIVALSLVSSVLFLASCTEQSVDAPAAHTGDSLDVVQQRMADGEAVLVDVREQSEWDEGHVAGAVLIPISEIRAGIDAEALAARLPKDKIIYTHCRAGRRAASACALLDDFGYDVRALKPGYEELIEAGFEKADDSAGSQRPQEKQ
jgi:rhodanese-related sulfurtransferase